MQNFVKTKLNSGKTVIGIWNTIPSPTVTELIACAGYDFQILDMEHGVFDFGTLENCIRSVELSGCSPLVRIKELSLADSQKTLDLGAHGLIFPQVKSAEDGLLATKFCQFPPTGVRGFNPFTRANGFGFSAGSNLQRDLSSFAMTSVIIENLSAQKQIDAILKTPNLDMVYLGAYDMSVAMGKPGDMKNPELVQFLKEGVKKIRDNGKAAGVMAQNAEDFQMYSQLGANFIAVGVDSFVIGNNFKSLHQQYLKFISK